MSPYQPGLLLFLRECERVFLGIDISAHVLAANTINHASDHDGLTMF